MELFIQTFNHDIFHEVASNLSVTDTLKFAQLLPWIHVNFEYLKKFWIRNVVRCLQNILISIGWTQQDIASLKETNSYIAGSFPLQCLLGEFWEGSDIDIFTKITQPGPDGIPIMNKIEKHGDYLNYHGFSPEYKRWCIQCSSPECDHCVLMSQEKSIWESYIEYLIQEGFAPFQVIIRIISRLNYSGNSKEFHTSIIEILKTKYPSYDRELSLIQCKKSFDLHRIWWICRNNEEYNASTIEFTLLNYLCEEQKVQIIALKEKDPLDYIAEFDFDFCKVYFDGEQLHVMNWDAVLTRTSSIKGKTRPSRIEKYENRKFFIRKNEISS